MYSCLLVESTFLVIECHGFWRLNSRSSADRWASSQPCVAEMFEPTTSTRYLAGFWVTNLQNNLLCLGESTSTSNFAGKPSKNCLASSETGTLKSSMYVYIITFPNLTENTVYTQFLNNKHNTKKISEKLHPKNSQNPALVAPTFSSPQQGAQFGRLGTFHALATELRQRQQRLAHCARLGKWTRENRSWGVHNNIVWCLMMFDDVFMLDSINLTPWFWV